MNCFEFVPEAIHLAVTFDQSVGLDAPFFSSSEGISPALGTESVPLASCRGDVQRLISQASPLFLRTGGVTASNSAALTPFQSKYMHTWDQRGRAKGESARLAIEAVPFVTWRAPAVRPRERPIP